VIVPLREHWNLRVEGAQIVVEQIVFIVAAELLQTVRDDGFFLRDDVPPERAVRQFQFRWHRAIGIDVIAGMNEEVRAVFQHGPVGPHAAAGGIDAPALARGNRRTRRTRPEFCAVGAVRKCRLSLACDAALGEIVKPHAVENILAGWQAVEQDL